MMSLIKKLLRILPDEMYIQLQYFYHFHRFANLKNPQTFNEKLQWLKLHDRQPLYTTLVDKYAVKKYVSDKIGPEYIIPTLGVWDKAEDIDFEKLPNQFVLKCTHDSHSIIICRDKSMFDKQTAIKKLSKRLKVNGYWYGREWPYKNVPPRIIAEKYMEDIKHELNDYKFLCFGEIPQFIEFHSGRFFGKHCQFFYDIAGQPQPFNNKGYSSENPPTLRLDIIEQMLPLVKQLACGISHVRVDFYYTDRPLFGEMTFFDGSGLVPFQPKAWDKKLGQLIKLPGRK